MNIIFKRIKSDLKDMFDFLQQNPEQERQAQKDLLLAQQIISDSLRKMKRSAAFSESKDQGYLFNQNEYR